MEQEPSQKSREIKSSSDNVSIEEEIDEHAKENLDFVIENIRTQIGSDKFQRLGFRVMPLIDSHATVGEGGDIFINANYLRHKGNIPYLTEKIGALIDKALAAREKFTSDEDRWEKIKRLSGDWIRAQRIDFSILDLENPDNFLKNKEKIETIFKELLAEKNGSIFLGMQVSLSDSGGTRDDNATGEALVDITESAENIKRYFLDRYLPQ